VRFRKIIRRRIDKNSGSARVAGAVNAVVSANVNEPGVHHTKVSSHQRVVQRGGRTVVEEDERAGGRADGTSPTQEEADG
jgi:hypothetical protein